MNRINISSDTSSIPTPSVQLQAAMAEIPSGNQPHEGDTLRTLGGQLQNAMTSGNYNILGWQLEQDANAAKYAGNSSEAVLLGTFKNDIDSNQKIQVLLDDFSSIIGFSNKHPNNFSGNSLFDQVASYVAPGAISTPGSDGGNDLISNNASDIFNFDQTANGQTRMLGSINVNGSLGQSDGPPAGMTNSTYVGSDQLTGHTTGGGLVFGQSTTNGALVAKYEYVGTDQQPHELNFGASDPSGAWSQSDLQNIQSSIQNVWPQDGTHTLSMQTLNAAVGNSTGQNSLTDSKQGPEGDCFFLTAVDAIRQRPGGSAQLLSLISQQPGAGNYTVTFPGDPNQKPYTVTTDDIQSTNSASGDLPTKILAIAADKWSGDNGGPGIGAGGSPEKALTLLTGKVSSVAASTDPNIMKNAIISASAGGRPITIGAEIDTGNGQSGHAIYIDSYDPSTGNVTWSNPWDSSQKYTQSIDSFVQAPQQPGVNYKGIDTISSETQFPGTVTGFL